LRTTTLQSVSTVAGPETVVNAEILFQLENRRKTFPQSGGDLL
jgi:hypothetical protein